MFKETENFDRDLEIIRKNTTDFFLKSRAEILEVKNTIIEIKIQQIGLTADETQVKKILVN